MGLKIWWVQQWQINENSLYVLTMKSDQTLLVNVLFVHTLICTLYVQYIVVENFLI